MIRPGGSNPYVNWLRVSFQWPDPIGSSAGWAQTQADSTRGQPYTLRWCDIKIFCLFYFFKHYYNLKLQNISYHLNITSYQTKCPRSVFIVHRNCNLQVNSTLNSWLRIKSSLVNYSCVYYLSLMWYTLQ